MTAHDRDGAQLKALLNLAADAMPGGPVKPPPHLAGAGRPRSRRLVPVLAGAGVLGARAASLPFWAVRDSAPPGPSEPAPGVVVTPPPGNVTASQLAHGRWETLPPAPIAARVGAASAWTGREMLIWGGRAFAEPDDLSGRPLNDGAAFDPATRTWRVLSASPLSPRTGVASVWTGQELFIWGGFSARPCPTFGCTGEGVLYNPATDTWRTVAAGSLRERTGAVAVWTGSEVVLLGGKINSGPALLHAAAYDPARDTWRELPAIPFVPDDGTGYLVSASVTPAGVDAWVSWAGQFPVDDYRQGVEGYRLDVAAGSWTPLPATPLHVAYAPQWTGDRTVFPAPAVGPEDPQCFCPPLNPPTSGMWLDSSGQWHRMAHGPLDDRGGYDVWTGAALLSFDASHQDDKVLPAGAAAAWDPATGTWLSVEDAPVGGFAAPGIVWTGTELLIWGTLMSTADAVGLSLIPG